MPKPDIPLGAILLHIGLSVALVCVIVATFFKG